MSCPRQTGVLVAKATGLRQTAVAIEVSSAHQTGQSPVCRAAARGTAGRPALYNGPVLLMNP